MLYNNQDIVIIDNLYDNSMRFNNIKTIINLNPFMVKVTKYFNHKSRITHTPFTSKHIIITSLYHPKEIFKHMLNKENKRLKRLKCILYSDEECKKEIEQLLKQINIEQHLKLYNYD